MYIYIYLYIYIYIYIFYETYYFVIATSSSTICVQRMLFINELM